MNGSEPLGVAILSTLSLGVSLYTLYRLYTQPLKENAKILQGFRRLEADVEDIFEKVQSHLGRISRLRRDSSKDGALVVAEVSQPAMGTAGSGAPSRTRQAIFAGWRRRHGTK